MGQKINPYGLRLGILYSWKSRWFANGKNYQKLFLADVELRKFLMEKLRPAGIFKLDIERFPKSIRFILFVSRPGVVIGRGGANLEELKKVITQKLESGLKIEISIEEIKNADINAQLILENVIDQLERRIPHRQIVNRAIERAMEAGAKGIKIVLAGRIAGAEISRVEKYGRGRLPLQTLRADIDYAERPALTESGYIGAKIWIYKGEEEI